MQDSKIQGSAPAGRCPLAEPPGASLDVSPLDLVFLEAALAADLITASRFLRRIPPRFENHKKGLTCKKGFATF